MSVALKLLVAQTDLGLLFIHVRQIDDRPRLKCDTLWLKQVGLYPTIHGREKDCGHSMYYRL